MAKKSKIVKNQKRAAIVARHAQRRAELKEIIRSSSSTPEQRLAAQLASIPGRGRGWLPESVCGRDAPRLCW
jgi:Ulp1 family protease